MHNLPSDPQAAFRYGLTVAYQRVLAELAEVEATIRREMRRHSLTPLPTPAAQFPSAPPGTSEGGEAR